jgi:hypothetical protein
MPITAGPRSFNCTQPFPIAFDKPGGNGMVLGYGDTEFEFKYRFLTEDEPIWWPQAAIYRAVDLPTGNVA